MRGNPVCISHGRSHKRFSFILSSFWRHQLSHMDVRHHFSAQHPHIGVFSEQGLKEKDKLPAVAARENREEEQEED